MQVIRGVFNRSDVVVASDCGAIGNMVLHNFYAKNLEDAAAKSFNGGCDLDLGDMFYSPIVNGGNGALESALKKGDVTEARVNASLARIFEKRFKAGMFDPVDNQPYTKIGPENINSTLHQSINYDLALQSLVLLDNSQGLLPLKPGQRVAVLGPHATSRHDLFSDYAADQFCFMPPKSQLDTYYCIPNIGEKITAVNEGGVTQVLNGVDFDSFDTSGEQAALSAAAQADVVVLCIGTSLNDEHETLDRKNITLPGIQEDFALKVIAVGKPVVLVLINGGIVSVDKLVGKVGAMVEAFKPAFQGAQAVADTLFGKTNRWGKVCLHCCDF